MAACDGCGVDADCCLTGVERRAGLGDRTNLGDNVLVALTDSRRAARCLYLVGGCGHEVRCECECVLGAVSRVGTCRLGADWTGDAIKLGYC